MFFQFLSRRVGEAEQKEEEMWQSEPALDFSFIFYFDLPLTVCWLAHYGCLEHYATGT